MKPFSCTQSIIQIAFDRMAQPQILERPAKKG